MVEENVLRSIRDRLHAMAQPLAAIAGTVDLLLMECDENNPMFKDLGVISDQLQEVLEIVAEIRRLAREASS